MKRRYLRWLALSLLGVALLLYLCILAGLPAWLFARVLSLELEQPVSLAKNPQISFNAQRVGIVLQGLQVGGHLLVLRQMQASWPWTALRAGRWLDMDLHIKGLNLHGPWPGSGSHSSQRMALPRVITVQDSSVDWPLGGHNLRVAKLQAHYRAEQGATMSGNLSYAGRLLAVQARYLAPQPQQAGAISLLAQGQGNWLRLQAKDLSLSSSGVLVIGQGTLRLVWKQMSGELHWQGLRYTANAQSLAIRTWRIAAQPQLSGEGNLLLHWQRVLTLNSQFQLQSVNLPDWLRLLGVSVPKVQEGRALRPAALSGDLSWTQDGPIRLDPLRGILGKTQFHGSLQRDSTQAPWQITAVIPQLDLDPWLSTPSSSSAPSPTVLPTLPKSWPPVRGELQVGQLRWGQWQARDLQIRLRAKSK